MGPSESTVVIKKTTPASIQTLLGDFIRHWVRVLLHASWTVKLWHGTRTVRKSCHSKSLAHAKERQVHYFNVTTQLSFWVKQRVHGDFTCFWKKYYGNPCALHYRSRLFVVFLAQGCGVIHKRPYVSCLLHSETRCGLQGNISIIYFPTAG